MTLNEDAQTIARPTTETTRSRRVLPAAIGSQAIEYYDFLIYGTAASLVFGTQFFPSVSPVVGVLAAFATFAVGFLGRPVGAAIFGHIGDRYGRKPAVLGSLLLMAVATLLIGLLPTYAAVGVLAPILLTVLRVLQGISIGGQWAGVSLLALEHAPPHRRGLHAALPQIGVSVGLIGGTLMFLLISGLTNADEFAAWGWRIPFLLTVLMFPIAYYMHRYIEDTPSFRRAEAALAADGGRPRSSVVEVFRRPRQMLLAAGTYLAASVTFYVVVTGVLDYATRELRIPRGTVLTATMISMVAFAVAMVGAAWLSDLVGRRPVYAAGAALSAVWAFALFPLIESANFGLILLALSVAQVAVGAMFGTAASMFAEMFPPEVRYAGASFGNQFANIAGGGLAPFIMVALLASTGTPLSVAGYVAAASVVSLVSLALVRFPRAAEDVPSS
ncbi:MFS transporter [Actinomycetospora sp. OC33-EN08]|uniref:MFS transporter n=1 Tax=Actinomycetospora aurantiaca TaxID=3129233 RepID=A0ABU8MT20_9PSEU